MCTSILSASMLISADVRSLVMSSFYACSGVHRAHRRAPDWDGDGCRQGSGDGRSKSSLATENLLESTLMGCSDPPLSVLSGRQVLPSIYADARYIDAVLVSKAEGAVAELAPPHVLAKQKGSQFASLIEHSSSAGGGEGGLAGAGGSKGSNAGGGAVAVGSQMRQAIVSKRRPTAKLTAV